MINYEGDNILIEEMPQGCVLSQHISGHEVVISSLQDALAVIESLTRMIKIQYDGDAKDDE